MGLNTLEYEVVDLSINSQRGMISIYIYMYKRNTWKRSLHMVEFLATTLRPKKHHTSTHRAMLETFMAVFFSKPFVLTNKEI